ncbi:putative ribonuclease H-like domain-containing protein [Tanacetum coccineum]|uniref:Ribonuclease H-like domain-containing protein n=1 Tax=Tanacetum coccineum TaxID=301880 RepID=A0ABQ5ERP7_9ASTR
MKKMYCLVVTDDYSRFSWVFFLATKDETSGILKSFITRVENLIDQKVKVIRCDNGTEFKNKEMNQFYERKGLKQLILAVIVQNSFRLYDTLETCYNSSIPIDHLGKFDGKADEGFFVGYSINSKAFRVFNSRTRIVEETLQSSLSKAGMETVPGKDYILLPLWTADPPFSQSSKSSPDAGFKPSGDDEKKVTEEPGKEGGDPSKEDERDDQEKDASVNSTNNVNAASTNKVNAVGRKASIELPDDPNMPALEDIVYLDDDEDVGAEADMYQFKMQLCRSSLLQLQVELKKVIQALRDPSWIEAMQDEFYNLNYKRFGPCSIKKPLCTEFEKIMHKKFQISSMGELIFFLGLQVKQKEDRTSISVKDNDYAGASLDRNSTTGGCQFLGCRLISWQCKKQTEALQFS